MFKYLKYILLGVLLFLTVIVLGKIKSEEFNINLTNNNMKYSIILKGAKNSRDFTGDEYGNLYIAYKSSIQFVDKKGKSYNIIRDKDYDISSLEYSNGKLYFASKDKVYSLDLNNKHIKLLISGLPNYGDYNKSNILIYDKKLYISVGTMTNSGVVGDDNLWVKDHPFYCDYSPFDVVLNGVNYGPNKTGSFVPFGVQNRKSQIISAHTPGNGSVVTYNLTDGKIETFAWGIRNIKGMDVNSKGKIIASVGGIEDRGLRPVKGDVDYIYEINKNTWYGWPDFSGGDPITSPRFRGSGVHTEMLLQTLPNSNPPAPIYQHRSINSISAVAIDKNGIIGEKDSIYFSDKSENIVYRLNSSGTISQCIISNKKSKIYHMKFIKNKLIILDEGTGYMYSIY